MILINENVLLQNNKDFYTYIDFVRAEKYTEKNIKVADCIIQFLEDVWDRDKKLTLIIQKKISPDIIPVILISISETSNLSKVEFNAVSKAPDFSVDKRQTMLFYQYCEKYFKSMISLYDRLAQIE